MLQIHVNKIANVNTRCVEITSRPKNVNKVQLEVRPKEEEEEGLVRQINGQRAWRMG